MIIEMYGPPGAGKTTLARYLSTHLRAQNIDVMVFSSARPGEKAADIDGSNSFSSLVAASGLAMRLRKPLSEIAAVARHPMLNYCQFTTALHVMHGFHGQTVLAYVRQAQYLVRLAQSWKSAQNLKGVAIFDQGFVQAMCSLAHNTRETRTSVIETAIRSLPTSHIAVRVTAPIDKVATRLNERRGRLGAIERYLESDIGPILSDLSIYDLVSGALATAGRRMITVASSDASSLDDAVGQIMEQIGAQLGSEWKGAA